VSSISHALKRVPEKSKLFSDKNTLQMNILEGDSQLGSIRSKPISLYSCGAAKSIIVAATKKKTARMPLTCVPPKSVQSVFSR
jgi:hypothetical protein